MSLNLCPVTQANIRHHFVLPLNTESGMFTALRLSFSTPASCSTAQPFLCCFRTVRSCIVTAPVPSEDYKYYPAFPKIPRIADSSFWLRPSGQLWNSLISRRAAQDRIIAAQRRRILVRRAASIIMWPHKSSAKTGSSPSAKASGHYQADESDWEVAVAECNATVDMTVSFKANT